MDLHPLTVSRLREQRTVEFLQRLSCELLTRDGRTARETFLARYPHSALAAEIRKAAIPPGGTMSTTWGSPLYYPYATEFYNTYIFPKTIPGRIQPLQRPPLNTRVVTSSSTPAPAWVGQGNPAPVSAEQLADDIVTPAKVVLIVVFSLDLVRVADPAGLVMVREKLINAVVAAVDRFFVDPAKAPVVDVSPGSITNGLTPIASSGPTLANFCTDLRALINAYRAGGGAIETATLLLSTANLIALGIPGSGGTVPVPIADGRIANLPYVDSEAVGNQLVLVDGAKTFVADDGTVELVSAANVTLQMDTAPVSGATALLSLFQNNLTAVRASKQVNWIVKPGHAAVVSGANYLG